MDVAVRQFAPSYKRARVMQVSLAVAAAARAGRRLASRSARQTGCNPPVSVGSFILIVIFPTTKQPRYPVLDARSDRVAVLLRRWNKLHAVRSALHATGFAQHGRWKGIARYEISEGGEKP